MIKILILSLALFMTTNVNSYKLKDNYYNSIYENEMSHSEESKPLKINYVARLTPGRISLGQVGGLDTDENGFLIVFHRASRTWEGDSFNESNAFNTAKYGAIPEDVLAILDPESIEIVHSWGKNIFYMPHGLTYDFEGNIWLTDVALHQVLKFDPNTRKIVMRLGEKFVNGNDESHFCKPTSVAVSESTGDIFVSDGYCNARIVQFTKKGKYVKSFQDSKNPIQVAHSIALLEKDNLICTVSRENGRIICFDIDSGEKRREITHSSMKTVFAIEYDPLNKLIHAVTGHNDGSKSVGLTFDVSHLEFGKLLFTWEPEKNTLTDAHDLALSPDLSTIYTGQLNGEIDEFSFVPA